MTSYLRDCEDCRLIVGAAAHVDREEARSGKTWPWWLGLAAAALAGAVLLYLWRPWVRDPVEILVAAAPSDSRQVEPRISGGFAWAPLHVQRRGPSQMNEPVDPLDVGQMKLTGAAGEVLERTAGDASPEARHAAALAHLLATRPVQAVSILASLATTAPDARVLNDLAAARYALSVQNDDPAHLAGALAAADEALRLRPDYPEAAFNRALILHRLGLRSQARAAWAYYLKLDSGSQWANEARRHLASLAPEADFRTELDREYVRLTRDPAAAAALASRFPQEARLWGETEVLARWAQSLRSGDAAGAAGHLRVARAFGDEIAGRSGERMLQAAVRIIEHAGDSTAAALAEGHLRFRDGQRTYRENRPAEAERMFAAAVSSFERAGSPVSLLARYFAANTAYDQGRIAEAREQLHALLDTSPPEFAAHRAQVRWQLGLADASLGQWGAAIRSLDESIRIFERLGEAKYATSVREILAEVYDRLGDPSTAWHHRLIALHELGRTDTPRLQLAVGSIARAAALDREWLEALAFFGLELEIARRNGNDVVTVETLLLRARVHERLAQKEAARSDLAEATGMISRLRDPALRERAETERVAVAALLASSPAESVTLLTQAIQYHDLRGRRMFLPEMLLQRGRALAAQGNVTAAAADFESGIRELEQQRTSLDAGDVRWGVISRGDELFDEAMALAFDRGDAEGAFACSERGRARELLESIERRHPAPPAAVKTNAMVIEYYTLPTRVIIFVVDDGRVRAVQERVARAMLMDLVERLGHSIASGDQGQFRQLATTLYERLVAPIATELTPGRPLVFIPDDAVTAVPFAALVGPDGRYLIERHAVTISPSTAVFHRLAPLHARPRVGRQLLLIAGPSAGDGALDPLSAAHREASEITDIYEPDTAVAAKDSDQAALARQAAAANVIHFAGHVAVRYDRRKTAIVASRLAGDDALLDVREIASMDLDHVRVVVLAACSSARGEDLAGEGSLSVARAFLSAGVPSVVATLWPIDDAAAAEFFPRLHRRLAAGTAPVDALRETQLDSIRRGTAPLSMWAAVQVHGS